VVSNLSHNVLLMIGLPITVVMMKMLVLTASRTLMVKLLSTTLLMLKV